MGRELGCEICLPCVVQWCMLWFSTPTRLNQTFGRRRNIHREVPRSCGHGDCGSDLHPFWRFAHTTNVYVDNVGCGFVEIGDVNKEMKGWRMEGRLVLLPFDDDGNEDADARESRGIFSLRDSASCVDFFFLFLYHKATV